MSDQTYFSVVLPLNPRAQKMAQQASARNDLRIMLWSQAAECMKALLGKTCSQFSPAIRPAGCLNLLPFGVALGAAEPKEFLMRYFRAKNAQADEIESRSQRIYALGQTVSEHQLDDETCVIVKAYRSDDPALRQEMEFAHRFFNSDITAAAGLYYLGFNECRVKEEQEKAILSDLSKYAICVAELQPLEV